MLDLKNLSYDQCDQIVARLVGAASGFEARAAAADAFACYTLVSFDITRGTTFWRARLCESPLGYQEVVDMSHPPPEKTGVGRLNETNQPLLYCATNPLTALSEGRATDGQFVQVVAYRHWPGAETRLACIGECVRLFRTRSLSVKVEPEVVDSLLGMLRRQGSDLRFMPSLYLDASLADVLANGTAEQSGYLATRAVAREALSKRDEIEGLIYPSVADPFGSNVAFKPDARNKLCVIGCGVSQILRKRRVGFYEFRMLNSAEGVRDNRFVWGPAQDAPLETMRIRQFNMTRDEALADQAEHQEAGLAFSFEGPEDTPA